MSTTFAVEPPSKVDILTQGITDSLMSYEPEVADVIERFVQPGDLVIDAGASIGLHTVLLSKLVADTGLVYAFEPDAVSFDHLLCNVGRLGNVRCLQQALWSHDAPALTLWSGEDLGYGSVAHRYDGLTGEPVEAVALDDLLPVEATPTVIKLDIEGAEEEALRGAEQTLRRGVHGIIVELNQHIMDLMGRSDHAIRDLMAGLGYDCFLLGFGHPIRIEPAVELRVEGGGRAVNVLFAHEREVRRLWA